MHEADGFRYPQHNIVNDIMMHTSFDSAPNVAMEFMRMPPEPLGKPINMAPGRPTLSAWDRKVDTIQIQNTIDGIRHRFSQKAVGLLSTGVLPIPPGHPLYSKQLALSALESERDSLLKENAELKQRLEGNNDLDATTISQ